MAMAAAVSSSGVPPGHTYHPLAMKSTWVPARTMPLAGSTFLAGRTHHLLAAPPPGMPVVSAAINVTAPPLTVPARNESDMR